jgi:GT2 family glycosyltransferase
MASVDVVVVTYNSAEVVGEAVRPLLGQEGVHVIVVDNASSDDTLQSLSKLPVEVLALEKNGGFAHGCNAGWRSGTSPYVLFLNPDAQLRPDALATLVSALEQDARLGIVAPRIEEPGGALDYSLRRFPRVRSAFAQALFLHRLFPAAPWVDEVIRDREFYEREQRVEWVSGACFLARRTALQAVGGLDESYFHYSEDVDLCARIWAAGLEVGYVPSALAIHEGGASAPRAALLGILAASRIRYAARHQGNAAALLMRVSIALGALGRLPTGQRAGHLKALRVALQPLSREPSRLVRGA